MVLRLRTGNRSLIHLAYRVQVNLPSAEPAPIMLTPGTRHMRTPPILLNLSLACRTVFDLRRACPRFKFFVSHVGAPDTRMSSCPTVHTHLLATLTSPSAWEVATLLSHVFDASWAWTPLQVSVIVHLNVHSEFHVLLLYFLGSEPLDIHFFELLLTPHLKTGYLQHLPFCNFGFQVITETVFAILMPTH